MKKILFFLCFLVFVTTVNAQLFSKKGREKVITITGVLTLHPDSVTIKGKDGKLYFFFLDAKNECLFITDNQDIYMSFAKFLPKEKIMSKQIEIEGTVIAPFTIFSKSKLKDESQKIGLKLNKYKIAKIFNYALSGAPMKYNPPN